MLLVLVFLFSVSSPGAGSFIGGPSYNNFSSFLTSVTKAQEKRYQPIERTLDFASVDFNAIITSLISPTVRPIFFSCKNSALLRLILSPFKNILGNWEIFYWLISLRLISGQQLYILCEYKITDPTSNVTSNCTEYSQNIRALTSRIFTPEAHWKLSRMEKS